MGNRIFWSEMVTGLKRACAHLHLISFESIPPKPSGSTVSSWLLLLTSWTSLSFISILSFNRRIKLDLYFCKGGCALLQFPVTQSNWKIRSKVKRWQLILIILLYIFLYNKLMQTCDRSHSKTWSHTQQISANDMQTSGISIKNVRVAYQLKMYQQNHDYKLMSSVTRSIKNSWTSKKEIQ